MRKDAQARLVLSVDLIGQAVSVEVDAADVQPYDVQPGATEVAPDRSRGTWPNFSSARVAPYVGRTQFGRCSVRAREDM